MTPQFVTYVRLWSAARRLDAARLAEREAWADFVLSRAFGPDGTGPNQWHWWRP